MFSKFYRTEVQLVSATILYAKVLRRTLVVFVARLIMTRKYVQLLSMLYVVNRYQTMAIRVFYRHLDHASFTSTDQHVVAIRYSSERVLTLR